MYTIKKVNVDDAEKLNIDNVLWMDNGYCPEVYAQIAYDDTGFNVKLTAFEKNPLRTKTKNFEFVHLDSCMEFFAKFTPDDSPYYINFEANANGVMNASYRTNRYDDVNLKEEEVKAFGIKSEILEDKWILSYKIPFEFIKKYFKTFDIDNCKYIYANLYKCGDLTEFEHYIAAYKIENETPDFHKPEFFQKIMVE